MHIYCCLTDVIKKNNTIVFTINQYNILYNRNLDLCMFILKIKKIKESKLDKYYPERLE